MSKTYRITGKDALRIARRENVAINCYANPIDSGGIVSIQVAAQIAKEDPKLIYVTVTPVGWRDMYGNTFDGEYRAVEAYFNTNGEYLGLDDYGVEPRWNDASLSDDAIASYLHTLEPEAAADWAAGKLDDVMTDHAFRHFGMQMNSEITRVAAAITL
jgi:hypothetical protein